LTKVFSKTVHTERAKHGNAILVKEGRKTRIEDKIERGCKKQNKKPDQETDRSMTMKKKRREKETK
jgi:hypothetical protein